MLSTKQEKWDQDMQKLVKDFEGYAHGKIQHFVEMTQALLYRDGACCPETMELLK
jgi:hypothetical protein